MIPRQARRGPSDASAGRLVPSATHAIGTGSWLAPSRAEVRNQQMVPGPCGDPVRSVSECRGGDCTRPESSVDTRPDPPRPRSPYPSVVLRRAWEPLCALEGQMTQISTSPLSARGRFLGRAILRNGNRAKAAWRRRAEAEKNLPPACSPRLGAIQWRHRVDVAASAGATAIRAGDRRISPRLARQHNHR